MLIPELLTLYELEYCFTLLFYQSRQIKYSKSEYSKKSL